MKNLKPFSESVIQDYCKRLFTGDVPDACGRYPGGIRREWASITREVAVSHLDKDTTEERNAAVQNLYLQCYTEDEISKSAGTPRTTIQGLLTEIQRFEIPSIPGQFAEDLADKTGKALKEAETARLAKIVDLNQSSAEHTTDFDVPIYNIWKQQTATLPHGVAIYRDSKSPIDDSKMQADAAGLLNIGKRTVERARIVQESKCVVEAIVSALCPCMTHARLASVRTN